MGEFLNFSVTQLLISEVGVVTALSSCGCGEVLMSSVSTTSMSADAITRHPLHLTVPGPDPPGFIVLLGTCHYVPGHENE